MSEFFYYAVLVIAVLLGFIGGARVVRGKVDGLLYIGIAVLLAMGVS